MKNPTFARASYGNLFLELFLEVGVPVRRWMDAAWLPEYVLEMPDVLVPNAQIIDVVWAAERHGDIDDIAYCAASRMTLGTLSQPTQQAVLRASTVGSVLVTAIREAVREDAYIPFWFDKLSNGNVRIHAQDPSGKEEPYCNWSTLFYLITTVRSILGPNWVPDEIALMGDFYPGRSVRDALPNTRFLSNQRSAWIAFPATLLNSRRTHTASEPKEQIRLQNPSAAPGWSLSDAVISMLTAHLPNETAHSAVFANALGLSERTFRRTLSQEGTSFRLLLAEKRMEIARSLLDDRDVRVTEVALSLGYRNATHFTRSFRAFHGTTPSQYRKAASADTGD